MAIPAIHPGEHLALELEELGMSAAEFWLNLQSLYELRLAERSAGKSIWKLPTLQKTKHPARHPAGAGRTA